MGPLISNFRGHPCGRFLFLHQKSTAHPTANAAGQPPHSCAHDLLTFLTSDHQQTHDGISVRARQSLRGANRAALKQALNRPCSEIRLRDHCVPRQFRVRFGEARFAGRAFPALDFPLTKVTSANADFVRTPYAGHIGLVFLGGQADNVFASALRLTPRAEQPCCPVSAGVGHALIWWPRREFSPQSAPLRKGDTHADGRSHRNRALRN